MPSLPSSLYKYLSPVLGALLAYAAALPADANKSAGIAAWFLVLDVVSGVISARKRGKITSRQFLIGLRDKITCHVVIVGLALGLGELTHQMTLYSFAWWGVCASEAFSIIENLRVLLRGGGKAMHPLAVVLDRFAALIERITGQFDLPGEEEAEGAATAAKAPAAPVEAKADA